MDELSFASYCHAAHDDDTASCMSSSSSYEVDDSMLADVELLCAYTSKKCTNFRTTKKGGGLHRFCEFHRRRANENQWRVDNKRRAVRAQRRQLLKRARAAMAATITAEPLVKPEPIVITPDDLALLQAMLFDDDCTSISSGSSATSSPSRSDASDWKLPTYADYPAFEFVL